MMQIKITETQQSLQRKMKKDTLVLIKSISLSAKMIDKQRRKSRDNKYRFIMIIRSMLRHYLFIIWCRNSSLGSFLELTIIFFFLHYKKHKEVIIIIRQHTRNNKKVSDLYRLYQLEMKKHLLTRHSKCDIDVN